MASGVKFTPNTHRVIEATLQTHRCTLNSFTQAHSDVQRRLTEDIRTHMRVRTHTHTHTPIMHNAIQFYGSTDSHAQIDTYLISKDVPGALIWSQNNSTLDYTHPEKSQIYDQSHKIYTAYVT